MKEQPYSPRILKIEAGGQMKPQHQKMGTRISTRPPLVVFSNKLSFAFFVAGIRAYGEHLCTT